jgi:hypothetical protein
MMYALPTGTESIKDEWGNDTLEVKRTYTEYSEYGANISSAVGEEAVKAFGSLTNYSRTICVAEKNCPIAVEGALIRFESKTYEVVKVADSLNGFLIAVREVI